MKKLSMLISLLLCVVIGGVYATWVYTESTDVADITKGKAVSMTEATYSGGYGTYTVNPDGLTMVVDPINDTDKSHTTGLKITGQVVITFTPSLHAPATVKENAVETSFWFTATAGWQYDSRDIFVVDSTHKNVVWNKQDDGTFNFVLSATDIAAIIRINEFELDTKAKYDEFDTALENGQIVIHVSDGQNSSNS